MSKGRDIEFGDKNNLETGPKWAQFGPNYFLVCCNHLHQLNIINKSQYAKLAKSNEAIWR